MRKHLSVSLSISLAVMSAVSVLAQAGNPNPGVVPTNSKSLGLSYGEWSARWWQWALFIPPGVNPILDATGANCAQGQSGHVWFLAGTFGGSAVRTCTVPNGTMLFFPILNGVFGSGLGDCPAGNPGAGCDVPTLRASATANVDSPIDLEVTVDGVPLKALSSYRAASPVFSYTVTSDNLIGLPAGTYSPVVSDGYWIMLGPLSTGAHTMFIKGVSASFFETDVTYHLTVGP